MSKKLKLNIQYFGSTNKTTHYDLSQYVASDKPTYLIDYNQDMAKIDAGIYDAMSKATVNEANIGTMQDLTTTVKSSLVSAINEVVTQLLANTSNIATNTSNIATLGTNQGDLVNLMTTAKNNLVSAINELKGVNDTQNTNINKNASDINDLLDKLTFTHYETIDISNITYNNCTNYRNVGSYELKLASNDDYSIIKLYGFGTIDNQTSGNSSFTIPNVIPSEYRPESPITITGSILVINDQMFNTSPRANYTVNTDGSITVSLNANKSGDSRLYFINSLIFLKDFNDIPV